MRENERKFREAESLLKLVIVGLATHNKSKYICLAMSSRHRNKHFEHNSEFRGKYLFARPVSVTWSIGQGDLWPLEKIRRAESSYGPCLITHTRFRSRPLYIACNRVESHITECVFSECPLIFANFFSKVNCCSQFNPSMRTIESLVHVSHTVWHWEKPLEVKVVKHAPKPGHLYCLGF